MRHTLNAALALTALALSSNATAHDPTYFTIEDFFTKGPGIDRSTIELSSMEIGPGLHLLIAQNGNAGNVLVSTGEDGTLIIDSMYAPVLPKIRAFLAEKGHDLVDFAINTHFHFDHADGNPLLVQEGTRIVAHEDARVSMSEERRINFVKFGFIQPPYPKEALPVFTFDERMSVHFNGNTMRLLHFGPAHTSGDAVILFEEANIIHMGDVLNNDGYPFLDVQNGGTIDGMIAYLKQVQEVVDAETVIVPGHGEPVGQDFLASHITMLETTRGSIEAMIEEGYTLEEVVAAKPTADFDAAYSHGTIASDPTLYVNVVYMDLANRIAD